MLNVWQGLRLTSICLRCAVCQRQRAVQEHRQAHPLRQQGRSAEPLLLHPRALRCGEAQLPPALAAQDGRLLPLRRLPALLLDWYVMAFKSDPRTYVCETLAVCFRAKRLKHLLLIAGELVLIEPWTPSLKPITFCVAYVPSCVDRTVLHMLLHSHGKWLLPFIDICKVHLTGYRLRWEAWNPVLVPQATSAAGPQPRATYELPALSSRQPANWRCDHAARKLGARCHYTFLTYPTQWQ